MIKEGNNKKLLEKYTPMEFAAVLASKYCVDGTNVFVGIGLSLLPAQLANKTRTPDINIIYESGIIDPIAVGRVPWGVDDSVIQVNAECHTEIINTLGWLAQTGRVEITYLGAAQIDRFCNLNTTLYGSDYTNPATRVSGSGGGHDLAIGANRFVVIMNHGKDRILDKLDYYTSPGYCEGGRTRWDVWGMPGGGPQAVFTTMAVLKPNPQTYEFEIAEIYPFTSPEEVKANTGYDIKLAENWRYSAIPSDEEIRVIRTELDITGDFTGWKKLALA
jgi:glutaconate CoA-transferase subunit B